MVILRLFCENSPRIIAALGADPAVLKTGCQALVCQFLPNLYTNFTKLSKNVGQKVTGQKVTDKSRTKSHRTKRQFKFCILTKHIGQKVTGQKVTT